MTMTSSRPYIFRAIHEWISDNGLTPYVLVDAETPGISIPEQHVENGKIILNVSPRAVSQWRQDNEWITFHARFNGRSREIMIPVHAVLAIYARENGKGMVFEKEGGPSPPPSDQPPGKDRKPRLQVIK